MFHFSQIVPHRRYITGIVDEPTQLLRPITGYSEQPLLSLEEACQPLQTLVPNLSSHVWIAKKNSLFPPNGLSQDESSSIHLYTMEWASGRSLYSELNHALKSSDRRNLRPWFPYLKLFLTALAKPPLSPSQTVWRGVHKNVNEDYMPGQEVTWWAFSSCTKSLAVLESDLYLGNQGERTLFSIEAINAKIISEHSHFKNEDEILLLPGTYMEVVSKFNPAAALHIVHLKQKIPPEVLLEPPYEGAMLYPSLYPTINIKKSNLWSGRKKKAFIIGGTISLVAILVAVLTGVLGSKRGSNISSTNIVNEIPLNCTPRHFAGISVDILWSFDCQTPTDDISSLYNGTGINNPTYSSPGFSGQGYALNLVRASSQYINISRQFHLTNSSFTITAWILPSSLSYALTYQLFGLCNMSCESIAIVYNQLSIDQYFTSNVPSLTTNQWQHVAYVFDATTSNQTIYYNGYLYSIHSVGKPVANYDDYIRTAIIGYGYWYNNAADYYDGIIDQMTFSFRMRNTSDILNEATLLSHYIFERPAALFYDSGPNAVEGSGVLCESINGSLGLITNNSYFTASGFVLFKPTSYSPTDFSQFSIAFWVKLFEGVQTYFIPIVRLTTMNITPNSSQTSCLMVLGFETTSISIYWLGATGMITSSIYVDINKTQVNTWYHLGITYSPSSGLLMYINGSQGNTTRTVVSYQQPTNAQDKLKIMLGNPQLGNNVDYLDDLSQLCREIKSGSITGVVPYAPPYEPFNGTIDDFRFYSRELRNDEIVEIVNLF